MENFKDSFFETNGNNLLGFDYETSSSSIIKVIGVGGGGGNAVNHMYNIGIHDVSFALCNTDNQALKKSQIPCKIQLGKTTTKGLGAGNKPLIAKAAAEESIDEIRQMLDDGTRMVFITAGMGGGTGTGAAPIIAKEAKAMDILTVGIVTIPFVFEGEKKIAQALDGVDEMSKNVDALLVINNERLCAIYPDLTLFNAFAKANDTLAVAAQSIAEIITIEGIINLDFNDVHTILKEGVIAIMSSGYGERDKRVTTAIDDALYSPLLNNTEVFGAQKVLFNIYFSEESAVSMEEIREITDYMRKFDNNIEVIWGTAVDNTLGNKVKMTLLATGFGMSFSSNPATYEKPAASSGRSDKNKGSETKHDAPASDITSKIEKVYGTDVVEEIKASTARASYYIFSMEDLDNDPLIEKIEQSPAYNRDKNFVRNLQPQQKPVQNEEKPVSQPTAPRTSTIQF